MFRKLIQRITYENESDTTNNALINNHVLAAFQPEMLVVLVLQTALMQRRKCHKNSNML